MRIIIAMDSFKGCMSSEEAGNIVAGAFSEILPGAEISIFPMADGGEGTADVIHHALGGERRFVSVTGPLGDEVGASFVLLPDGRTAVMDVASASGIELVDRSRLDPLTATSFGTGELMRAALDEGVEEIILGVGGSATVDGGLGMAQALGFGLRERNGFLCVPGGQALATVAEIDSRSVHPALGTCRVRVARDVNNPLLGERGAARVFGPQKGATPEVVEGLEEGLENLAGLWIRQGWLESVDQPGDGAAGGLGAALRAFCGAEIYPGAELVADMTGLIRALDGTDLLITGEGRTDRQTADGKLCWVLAEMAKNAGVQTALISGSIAADAGCLLEMFDIVFATVDVSRPVEKAIREGRQNLVRGAARLASKMARGGLRS